MCVGMCAGEDRDVEGILKLGQEEQLSLAPDFFRMSILEGHRSDSFNMKSINSSRNLPTRPVL